jgi:hypothetical protein
MEAIGDYNTALYPKPLLLTQVIHTIKLMVLTNWLAIFQVSGLLIEYESVWLIDDDLSLHQFSLRLYHTSLDCAFRERPLVSQPLIRGDTQAYSYLNYGEPVLV